MENPTVKLVAPTAGATVLGNKSKVEFKTFKVYTPAEAEGSNDIWLANISFTPETLESGMFLINKLIELGVQVVLYLLKKKLKELLHLLAN